MKPKKPKDILYKNLNKKLTINIPIIIKIFNISLEYKIIIQIKDIIERKIIFGILMIKI